MRPDDNWKETRLLVEDISLLLGTDKKSTEEFLKVIENLIIHKFVEQVLDSETSKGDESYSIELPYLGSLVINIIDKKISIDFVPRKVFYSKIKKAYNSKESPLVKQCSEILGEDLISRLGGENTFEQ